MNSELYDKTYRLPSDVLKHIQATLTTTPQGDGVRRAKFLLKNGVVTYQTLKRLKNYFDYYDGKNPQEFNLAGGDPMKVFVDRTLQNDRDAVETSKEVRRDLNVNMQQDMKAAQTPELNEGEEENKLQKNALGIIVGEDNKILLLKRADDIHWQPGKWSLVGGMVEDGEDVLDACKREIKEETGLELDNFREKYAIQRNPESIEYIFITKYDGDPDDIDLDLSENTHYGWYLPEEMKFLDHVPNLIDYINLAFKKYE